jgi:hypothetical protein
MSDKLKCSTNPAPNDSRELKISLAQSKLIAQRLCRQTLGSTSTATLTRIIDGLNYLFSAVERLERSELGPVQSEFGSLTKESGVD